MYKTHLALTILLVIMALPFLDVEPILFLLVALIATLIPDIDHSNSKLGQKVPIVGMLFKHRGIWHSVFPLFGFPFLISFYLKQSHQQLRLAKAQTHQFHKL